MSALIVIADLLEHVETDLPRTALQRIIDDADAAIIERFGAHADYTITEDVTPTTGSTLLFPRHRVASVTTITEYEGPLFDVETETELDDSDYRLENGGRAIRRLSSGDNAATVWGDRVEMTYTPVADNARRIRVTLDLCQLALTYRGSIKTETAGDYEGGSSLTPDAYQKERERLLSELAPTGGIVFA